MSDAHLKVIESLHRIRDLDVNDLVQKVRLGENAFEAAIIPATRVQSLFLKVPIAIVSELSQSSATSLNNAANATYSRFQEILDFDLEEGAVKARRDALVGALQDSYNNAFDTLLPIISFSIAETTDFTQLEERGRASIQTISDSTAKIENEIKETLEGARALLDEVRSVAAEEGVLNQAQFFRDESSTHSLSAKKWLIAAICCGVVLLAYTSSTLIFSQSSIFQAATTYGSVQIAVSKVLLFSVLTYSVLSCVKIYRSHRHNSVVNKHRQNALMTYRTLSEAGATPEARDIILNHAAAAIYAPVDSGYVSNEERGYGSSLPTISLSPKPLPAAAAE